MLSAHPRVAALASPFRLVASLVLAAVLLAVPGKTLAGIMSLTVAPPSGPSGTVVTLSGSGAVPLATLRIFSEPWTSGGHCGTVTEPQLVGEITASESGTFQTTLRAIRSTSEVLGITYYAWDPDHQLPSNTACFTFQETPSVRYFPVTGHWVAHGFLAYWETFGGLPVFGYPITEEFQENGLTVQYFERARFEWHPDAWPERYDVLLSRLGDELLPSRQPNYPPYPFAVGPASDDPACRFFPMPPVSSIPATAGYNVCRGFRAYWEAFGGLATFGYPLSQEYIDPQTGLVVQWFERARFEWHPDAWPERFDVLPGRVGAERLAGS